MVELSDEETSAEMLVGSDVEEMTGGGTDEEDIAVIAATADRLLSVGLGALIVVAATSVGGLGD